ncbi:phospholipase D-like domain-containing protein [Blautia sp.]
MKKILKRTGKVFCLFLLIVVLVNVLLPLFCRKPDEKYVESLRETEFTSETAGTEKICCIDDNEEALLWRLRMIGTAKESIVLSTFDLRADDNGTKILAALNCAAARGVKIQLLIDGIYQQLFLAGSSDFQALASYENVEVGVYNPVTPVNLFKVNYRMHDKYLIVDEKMYLLGGRNSNDIFLGDQTKGINEDRDILVYDTSEGQGESLNQLQDYFHKIWKESCVSIKKGKQSSRHMDAYRHLEEIYTSLLKKYNDIETYSAWEKDTTEANKITLINNGTGAGRKTPQVLQAIQYLTENADHVIIQTPYVICNGYMYDVLQRISDHAKLQIVLNAVEKGSNPWGCTDYLNQKKKILETGADVYELMNDYPVHTKAVLIDDRLSVAGSYNLDMRSTYLDTELMLVIDSEKLSEQIYETESDYMEKSKEVLANGQETEGAKYQGKVLSRKKKLYYGVLRIIIRPLRQLL